MTLLQGKTMMKSMTGYGTATAQVGESKSATVEVKSVNHKYCDVHVKLPVKLSFLENDIFNYIFKLHPYCCCNN